jgi:hypothetical protein
MNISVRDEAGAEIPFSGGGLRLEEATSYRLVVARGEEPPKAWLGDRELPFREGQGFAVEIGHWVGESSLRIVSGSRTARVPVVVAPCSEKLSDAAWLSMLGDLESWNPGLPVGLAGGGVGAVGTEGTPAPVLAVALLPLVAPLLRAVRAIATAPRERTAPLHEDIPLRAVRQADREVLRWLSRHPHAARALDPWRVAKTGLPEPEVPRQTTRDTADHPANRYLAWLVRRVAARLGALADALGTAARHPGIQEDTEEWCTARALAASVAAESLLATMRGTFLGTLAPMPPTEAALLAVQDDPAYARAQSLARPFLSPRFHLPDVPGNAAPTKPSFELYELWTLLAVHKALLAHLGGWAWSWHPKPGPELLAGFGPGSSFAATGPNGERLALCYNLTFPGYLHRADSSRYSISGERRPDIVLTLAFPGRKPAWFVLDAKYRVTRQALADAFTSLHIYRDSLRWDSFGGSCRGGLLLVPAIAPGCEPWFSASYLDRFGIGVRKATPGEPADIGLKGVLCDTLSRKNLAPLVASAEPPARPGNSLHIFAALRISTRDEGYQAKNS